MCKDSFKRLELWTTRPIFELPRHQLARSKGSTKMENLAYLCWDPLVHESPDLMGTVDVHWDLSATRWPWTSASVFSCVGPSPCFAGFLGMALSNWTVNMVKFGVPCLRTNPDLSLGLVYLVHLGIPRRKKTMTVNYYKLFLYRSKMADGTMAEKWGMNNELQWPSTTVATGNLDVRFLSIGKSCNAVARFKHWGVEVRTLSWRGHNPNGNPLAYADASPMLSKVGSQINRFSTRCGESCGPFLQRLATPTGHVLEDPAFPLGTLATAAAGAFSP